MRDTLKPGATMRVPLEKFLSKRCLMGEVRSRYETGSLMQVRV
jgi:hypothetical protein